MRFDVVRLECERTPIARDGGAELLLIAPGEAEPVVRFGAIRIKRNRLVIRGDSVGMAARCAHCLAAFDMRLRGGHLSAIP